MQPDPRVLERELRASLRRHAALPALYTGTGWMSYAELYELALAEARKLRELMGQGVVGLGFGAGPQRIVAALSVLFAGQVQVYLDPQLPEAQGLRVRRQAGVDMEWDAAGMRLKGIGSGQPEAAWSWVFSSGSSGKPQAYLRGQPGTYRTLRDYIEVMELGQNDCVLQTASPRFANFASNVWSALLVGARLVPFDMAGSGSASAHRCIEELQVTTLHLTPSVLRKLVQHGALPSVRKIKLGGEPLRGADLNGFRAALSDGCRVLNGLAQTQLEGNYCYHQLDWELDGARDWVPVGKPCPGYRLELQDGQLWVSGATPVLASRPPSGLGERFATGDLGEWSDGGDLIVSGRLDGVVQVAGVNVSLTEVEGVLGALPGIEEVHVRQELAGQPLRAYALGSREQWRADCAAVLPAEAVPASLTWVEVWPRLANGKLDRAALLEPPGRPGLAARHSVDEQMLAIWSTALPDSRPGIDDDFFALGGDSVAAATILTLVERHLGEVLDSLFLLRHPTVRAFVDALEQRSQGIASVVTLRQGRADGPVVWVVLSGEADESAFMVRRWADGFSAEWSVFCWHLSFRGTPLETVEAMAVGMGLRPALLVGDCLGHYLASQVAARRRALGVATYLVALNPRWLGWWNGLERRWIWLRAAFKALFRLGRDPHWIEGLRAGLLRLLGHLRKPVGAVHFEGGSEWRFRQHLAWGRLLGGGLRPDVVLQVAKNSRWSDGRLREVLRAGWSKISAVDSAGSL